MGIFFADSNDFFYSLPEETIPLDILLELCKKGKVDIKNIFLSDITEKYMEYIASLEEKDYDNISSFILLASTLLEYKSAALLPKTEFTGETEENTPEELFLMRLEEYRLLKEASDKLKDYEILNRFYRDPVFGEDEYKLVIKSFNLDKMIAAFTLLMERVEFEEDAAVPKTIIKERFTVADRVLEIIEIVRAMKTVSFFNLFENDYTKQEIINTFLAILEILKQQIASAEQPEPGGDIILRHTPTTDKFNNNEEELLANVDGYN